MLTTPPSLRNARISLQEYSEACAQASCSCECVQNYRRSQNLHQAEMKLLDAPGNMDIFNSIRLECNIFPILTKSNHTCPCPHQIYYLDDLGSPLDNCLLETLWRVTMALLKADTG